MHLRTLFEIAYLAGFAWLGSWELAAFIVNHTYTISDLTWQFEGIGWTAARYFVLVVMTFFTLHLAFEWLR